MAVEIESPIFDKTRTKEKDLYGIRFSTDSDVPKNKRCIFGDIQKAPKIVLFELSISFYQIGPHHILFA